MIIAFVQLGPNPAVLLPPFASYARRSLPESDLVLISDRKRAGRAFPGRVVLYSKADRPRWIGAYERKFPAESSLARGFWVRSIERLFALRLLASKDSGPLVHLESDVISFANASVMRQLRAAYARPAVPRSTAGEGCASFLYVPDADGLERMLCHMEELLMDAAQPLNDMALLGMGLRDGSIDALPGHPHEASDAIAFKSQCGTLPVIFDASPYGGYLFGRDPIHSQGKSISGYIHPGLPNYIQASSWGLTPLESPDGTFLYVPTVETRMSQFAFAALHVSAKYDPGATSPDSRRWGRILGEANGTMPRRPHMPGQRSVHNYGDDARSMARRAMLEVPARWARTLGKFDPGRLIEHKRRKGRGS